MNSRLKQIFQPRKILIFAFSLFLIVLLQLFVDDWQVKIFGFFLVLVIDIFCFTDSLTIVLRQAFLLSLLIISSQI